MVTIAEAYDIFCALNRFRALAAGLEGEAELGGGCGSSCFWAWEWGGEVGLVVIGSGELRLRFAGGDVYGAVYGAEGVDEGGVEVAYFLVCCSGVRTRDGGVV